MTKPRSGIKRPTKAKESKRTTIPRLRIKKGASLKAIHAAARRSFSAADLQKYTEVEPGIPAQQILAELEAIDRSDTQARKRRAKP